MRNELVSVVITTCNREKKILKEAIDSVMNQTYSSVEIILVNDSPFYINHDKIHDLVQAYGNSIKYIVNEETLGANASRNKGADLIKGNIISFLDDDDKWGINRIEEMMQAFDAGADVVYSDMYIFNDKSKTYSSRGAYDHRVLTELLQQNFLGGFSNVAFRKEAFLQVGKLDPNMKSYQDVDLWIRFAERYKIVYIPKALTFYRVSPYSISLNESQKYEGLMMFLHKYESLYDKYPKCKQKKLENEMVYYMKNGWFLSAGKLWKIMKDDSYSWSVYFCYLLGLSKYIAVRILTLKQ